MLKSSKADPLRLMLLMNTGVEPLLLSVNSFGLLVVPEVLVNISTGSAVSACGSEPSAMRSTYGRSSSYVLMGTAARKSATLLIRANPCARP